MGELTPNDLRQYRGLVKLTDGEKVVSVTSSGDLKVSDSRVETTSESGGQKRVFTQDFVTENTLNKVLQELKILNLHMSVITDNIFNGSETEIK